MRRSLLLGVSAIIVLAILGFVLLHKQSGKQPAAATATNPPAQTTTAVIEITSSGFIPKTLAIKAGTKVFWVNEDVKPHLPAADPYPSHKSLPNLIAPMALGQKETYSYLFTKSATVSYHDQINPTLTGAIEIR